MNSYIGTLLLHKSNVIIEIAERLMLLENRVINRRLSTQEFFVEADSIRTLVVPFVGTQEGTLMTLALNQISLTQTTPPYVSCWQNIRLYLGRVFSQGQNP